MTEMTEHGRTDELPINPGTAPKLTEWANEPTALVLMEDLELARPAHDLFVTKIQRWVDLMEVKNAARPKKVKGRSNVQPKLNPAPGRMALCAIERTVQLVEQAVRCPACHLRGCGLSPPERDPAELPVPIEDQSGSASSIPTCAPVWTKVPPWCGSAGAGSPRKSRKKSRSGNMSLLVPKEEMKLFETALKAKAENPRGFMEQAPPEMQAAIEFYEGGSGQPNIAYQIGTENDHR